MFVNFYSPKIYYKNNTIKQNDNVNFTSIESKRSLKADRQNLVLNLEDKMKTCSDDAKDLYRYGIDFINKNLDEEGYIKKMYDLIKNKKFGAQKILNRNESDLIGYYGLFFSMHGPNPNATSSSIITDYIKSLLDY